jgi:cytochrome c554/c'-like protein
MRSLLLALVLGAAGCGESRELTFTGLAGSAERLAANARCESCHVEVATEWRRSRHRAAFSNAHFTRAYQAERDPFCAACHAPEARASDSTPSSASDLGVACVTCHLDGDGAVRAAPGTTASRAPHGVRRTEELRGDRACAGCHEFAFPRRSPETAELMQTTITEHLRSGYANVSCATCHMPKSANHRRMHDFGSTRSDERVRDALRIQAERSLDVVRLKLTTRRVGHAFPTGDLFRRLRLTAEAFDEQGVARREQRYLARHFRYDRQADGRWLRTLTGDDRPGGAFDDDGEVTVELALGPLASGRALRWQVAYERVAHLDGDSEDAATVAESISIASGILAH